MAGMSRRQAAPALPGKRFLRDRWAGLHDAAGSSSRRRRAGESRSPPEPHQDWLLGPGGAGARFDPAGVGTANPGRVGLVTSERSIRRFKRPGSASKKLYTPPDSSAPTGLKRVRSGKPIRRPSMRQARLHRRDWNTKMVRNRGRCQRSRRLSAKPLGAIGRQHIRRRLVLGNRISPLRVLAKALNGQSY
jgi:hypothetical protein